jgi:hypothetical protein
VLSFFKRIYADRPDLGQRPPTIVRTDRFKVFDSGECQLFYDDNDCFHQEASAYCHHQVAAERDVQTVLQNVAASTHTNDFIIANTWARAVSHWTEVHGDTPLSETGMIAPNQMLWPGRQVDLAVKYRFAFGDICCYPLEKGIERKKFDL